MLGGNKGEFPREPSPFSQRGSCYRRDVCTLGERAVAAATSGTEKAEEVDYLVGKLAGYLSIRSARIFYVAMRISIPGSSSCIPRAKLSREDAKPAAGTSLELGFSTTSMDCHAGYECYQGVSTKSLRCKELDSRASRFHRNPARSKFQRIRKSNFHCSWSPSKVLSFKKGISITTRD